MGDVTPIRGSSYTEALRDLDWESFLMGWGSAMISVDSIRDWIDGDEVRMKKLRATVDGLMEKLISDLEDVATDAGHDPAASRLAVEQMLLASRQPPE